MITLSKSGSTVTFTFDENSGYLQNGTIDVPVNSLSLILDESNMATFRKSASNDIFVSANIAEFGMSKSDLEAWYKANMVGSSGGGGGVTSGEVQTMIDNSISSAITSGDTKAVAGGAVYDQVTIGGGMEKISTVTAASYTSVVMPDCDKFTISAGTAVGDTLTSGGKVINVYDKSTDTFVFSSSSVSNMSSNYVIVEGTTADTSIALSTVDGYYFKGDNSMMFKSNYSGGWVVTFYKNADAEWLKNVVSAHTTNATIHVTAADKTAWNAKQDTLTAGRAIDISANTISFDLPISAGTGVNSLLLASVDSTVNGQYSVAHGHLNTANGDYTVAYGNRNTSNNFAEASYGQKNVSRTEDASSFGHSGNTLFTVGNGIINTTLGIDANHNAFEVRGNGDIYIADTNATGGYYEKPMIKLQDALGGSVDSAITSGSTNAVASSAIWSAVTYNKEVTVEFNPNDYNRSTNFPYGCTIIKVEVNEYQDSNIDFYSVDTYGHYNPVGSYSIDNYGSLSVDNDFDDSTYTTDGNTVIITWPLSKNIGRISVSNINRQTVKAVVAGAWVNENTYMKSEVNAIQTTLQNNINQKLDSTAYTPTVVDSALSVDSTNPVQNKVLFGELRAVDGKDPDTVITWSSHESSNFPSGCTSIVVNVPNQGNNVSIRFYDSNDYPLGTYDIMNYGQIDVNNRFDGSTYTTSGTSVTITWNSSKNVAKLVDIIGNSPSVTAIGATTYISVKNSLGGFKLLQITQSDYDALNPNYDANTLYIIVN